MNFFDTLADIPLALRLIWLFAVGTCIGSFINVCVGRLTVIDDIGGQFKQLLGSSECQSCKKSISWKHNIPIFSWLFLRGKCAYCGASFSIRYLLVELFTGIVFVAVYYWIVVEKGLVDPRIVAPNSTGGPMPTQTMLHMWYVSYMILFSLMLTATLTDYATWLIPDGITVPGTLAGLILAVSFPWAMLPTWNHSNFQYTGFLSMLTEQDWPPEYLGYPHTYSLFLALGCFIGWCLALLPWQWYFRWGPKWTAYILYRRLTDRRNLPVYVIAILGSIGIIVAWSMLANTMHWRGLLSSLVAMAMAGGGLWALRIMASFAYGQEALGFGDVTLIAMIAAFLGWQAAFIGLCLGSFYGVAGFVVHATILRNKEGGTELPYGPYICMGVATVAIRWEPYWHQFGSLFITMKAFIPGLLLFCLLLAGATLMTMRSIRRVLG